MAKNTLLKVLFIAVLFSCMSAHAQRITEPQLKNIVKSTINTYEKNPVEKLYIQTDKPGYLSGDTIRFKAYLLNGDYLGASTQSGILYVELDDEKGKNVKRMMLPVSDGLAWADMPLDTADVKQGNYTLRAYTNWMRNFGEDYIFKKSITISRHTDNPLLVNSLFKQTGNKVEGQLQLKMLDGKLQAFKDVQVKLMSGKKNLSKDKLTTGIDGKIPFNFILPENNEPVSIKLATTGSDEVTVPVALNRLDNTDVQFMPEGGALVAGIPGKIGIKAIGEDGKGINISGRVLNSTGEQVALINTVYKGMGSFMFSPIAGESYIAKFNGVNKSYPLPLVKSTGTVLSITASNPDLLTLSINATPDHRANYYLIGQARGVVCYAEPINLLNGTATKSVDKNLFPTGIVRFTLIGTDQQPVNERIVFVNHKDEFRFNIQPDKSNYASRDSIALSLQVTDKDGKPVQGNFSMAVTDNSQVKIDSLGGNILTNLLLTSDLKGEIETPNYYFAGNKETELDNLILTQGWVGYDWKEILSPEIKPIAYQPEKEFVISGKVTNAFNSPIERSQINLISNRPLVIADTLTDKKGRFEFRGIWPVDTAIFKLQARNKNKKEFNVAIKMDEQSFPDFKPNSSIITPWYVNADTILLNNATSILAEEKAKQNYMGAGTVLKEVNIKAKKVVKGSHNLNGPGEADLIIDEKEVLKAGKKTLSDLLREKVPQLITMGGHWSFQVPFVGFVTIPMDYTLDFKKVHFIIDGISIENPDWNAKNRYNNIKSYLDYFTAEDITGIEIMNSPKYAGDYHWAYYKKTMEYEKYKKVGGLSYFYYAYIEITTRTGHGPFMKVTPGTYLYKPLAFTLPKQFYSPKYTVQNKSQALGTDMRSTIFWEPNIITDAAGKATVSFYSADKAANYSVIIEGTDMSGGLGFGKKEIKLTP